ncbi:MAG: S8 family serine peptidase [Muribaculaceae bacterium]|nr:S8 family serine peptidase [Muribaculaceae bacterium]
MRKVSLSLLAAGIALCAQADKTDIASRARLRAAAAPVEFLKDSRGNGVSKVRASQAEPVLKAFVTLAPGTDASVLESVGATVRSARGTLALAEFPQSALEAVEALEEVERISLERPVARKLDLARAAVGVDKIHQGAGLPQPYTGKGVVAGIVDGGFDPNHVNFLNADGTSRIGQFTYYRPTQSGDYVEEIYGRDYIPVIDTESDDNYHGTHTLGIMAGSYRGPVTAAVRGTDFSVETVETANPYYGVATEADLALACGALTDYHIAMGVETILNYAYYEDKPAVVNLSLGSNVGPHDGSSTICQYLDLASAQDRVVFCLAAGNEGELPIALHKTFAEDDLELKSCLYPAVMMSNYSNVRYGQTYIYSDSPTQFEVQMVVVNLSRGVEALRLPLPATDGGSKYWVSEDGYVQADTDVVSPQFAKWFTGYIGVNAEFDQSTGRYYAVLDYMCWDNTSGNPTGNYVVGFQVKGSPGQRVDVFCDGVYNYLDDYGIGGYSMGMADGTISDVACGDNCVVVGSYNTRLDWASLDGGIYGYDGTDLTVGRMSPFTSYGRLFDGRERPTVCAPGAAIISSSNEYYLDAYQVGDESRQAVTTANGRRYSWHQSTGTSMSTPVVAGSVALWLEADPTLRYDDVLDIIAATAVRDEDVENTGNPLQWGAGKFDAYAGLREVLSRREASLGDVAADADRRLVFDAAGDRRYRVCYGGRDSFTLSLYSASGSKALSVSANGGEAVVDASSLPAGFYILAVDGAPAADSARIILK